MVLRWLFEREQLTDFLNWVTFIRWERRGGGERFPLLQMSRSGAIIREAIQEMQDQKMSLFAGKAGGERGGSYEVNFFLLMCK